MTHTLATLEVSAYTFCEIRDILIKAGYPVTLESKTIDMNGLALVRKKEAGGHVV